MYLRNTWYVAGFADEIDAGRLLARRILDQPVVFFRGPERRVAALADRCPHRFAPLSRGKLCDGGRALQCGYHGLRFDGTGACVHNPHAKESIPRAARVVSYAAAERHGLLWWWAGDPTLADPDLIPDYSSFEGLHPDSTFRGYLPTRCQYELLVDNILDLTHADYLHAGSREFVEYAFTEQDKPMLEAQYQNIAGEDFWALKPVLLSTDAAAVRARRKLARLVAAEAQSSP